MTYAANDVVLGRHLDTAEKRIKREIDKIAADGASVAVFTGATAVDGTSGLVPAPLAGDNGKFLRGDGTWATVPSGNTDGGYVIGSNVSNVEGGFWQSEINNVPILKLRHGDYEYNFNYDSVIALSDSYTPPETTTPNTYVLGTEFVSADGGVWYEVSNNVPTLNLHVGNFQYVFNYNSITYKGSNTHLAAYLPFDSSTTADACGNIWVPFTGASEGYGTLTITDDTNVFTGKSANFYYAALINQTIASELGSAAWAVDFWARSIDRHMLYIDGQPSLYLLHDRDISHLVLYIGSNQFVLDDLPSGSSRRHFALTYDCNTLRVFCNGTLWTEQPASLALSGRFVLGSGDVAPTSDNNLGTARIDHFRIFKGDAIWTENFTPPTAEDYT